MRRKIFSLFSIALLTCSALAQTNPKNDDEKIIRIGTDLIQLDAVVTDKAGRIVNGLKKEDFEIIENGKKQQIGFFEFVDVAKKQQVTTDTAKPTQPAALNAETTIADVNRIFAFVVDDLTIRFEDLIFIRQMLLNFVENRMQPGDLIAIVRTVGGKGLLQQFTTDKNLLKRAIASLTPTTHAFRVFDKDIQPIKLNDLVAEPGAAGATAGSATETSGEEIDIDSPQDDTNKALRALMSLGTANFVVDSMTQLPGRKSLVLFSGGLPILSANPSKTLGNVSYFLERLSDNATRAGVAIHTMDVRGLQAFSGVASFDMTPGRSAVAGVGSTGAAGGFGRVPDETQFGDKNPFDQLEGHMGLKTLSAATGGISVLEKNNFIDGLDKIISANDGFYLLAYTPMDTKFDNKFRKVEIKVKGEGLKVYSRRGYMARADAPTGAPATRQEQLLAAIKAPLARRDIDIDAMLLYKSASPTTGAIDIHLAIDPRKVEFETSEDKQKADLEVAGFVFDELGKLRGGFSENVAVGVLPQDMAKLNQGGIAYSANTNLPAGIYQIRIAVRDNKTGKIGTLSRYIEVPDLTKGRLTASTLLLGAAPANDMKAVNPVPINGNRQISRKSDLRYAVVIYNAKVKDNKPQVKTQLTISHNGKEIFKEEEIALEASGGQLIKVGQLGLGGVKPGRYTLTLTITDGLADKKAQTIVRSMDFVVVN
ncbi:MAG: VWA domain-containing protein [Acidobacteriota bacterium]